MEASNRLPATGVAAGSSASSPAQSLERGEVVYYPVCPFVLPQGEDYELLLAQRLGKRAHKNISYDPNTGKLAGFAWRSSSQMERLRIVFALFSQEATNWLARTLPAYERAWRLDQVSYRPEEEATRRLRQKARNDLLHVDAFPSRPTNGHRILRLFTNINPTEPRVWVTSDPFAELFARYGREAGLPSSPTSEWAQRLGQHVFRIFHPGRPARSAYDSFMLRFHDFLKANDEFQERGRKRFWSFPPSSAWLAFTDTCSHAVLRGRFALEHSYFVAPEALVLPEESPSAILARACGLAVLNRAA